MPSYPQARDFIDTPRITTPRTIADELRRIAAEHADEPEHVLIQRIATAVADYIEHEMKMRELGRG